MKTALHKKSQKGFTLIELLVVIGILAVLLAITLIAINPARQFEQANDTQRSSDVNAILNAVWQYGVEEGGNLGDLNIPVGVYPDDAVEIAADDGDAGTNEVDFCAELTQTYIAQMPIDPTNGQWDIDGDGNGCEASDYRTGYFIVQSDEGRVTVGAPSTEGDVEITVSR